jgi:branched-chain amino acid transport system substrate-binding protein
MALLASGEAAAEIHIGTAGPLSGQYADFGKEIVRGAQMAVDDINAAGGMMGQQLVLSIADDGCDPRKATEAARSLIGEGVVFVAGHYCSFASIPAAPIYAEAGVVMISPSATNPKFIAEGGWNTLRVRAGDDAQGTFAGGYLAAKYRTAKIALIDDGSPYGSSLTANARKALQAAGVKEASNASFKAGEKDFSALVAQLRENAIDVVYAGGFHPELGLFVREMRRQGLQAQFISGDSLVTDEFWTIAGDAAEGSLMTFPPDPMKNPAAAPLVARFKTQGYTPEGATLYAYAAVQAWAQGIAGTFSTDGRQIAQWLRAGHTVKTVVGPLTFDSRGDVKDAVYDWYRWSHGKYAVVNPAP